MPQTKSRIVGNAYTVFHWQGTSILWLDAFQDSAPKPITSPQAVHPIGSRHPEEIVVNRAMGAGTLTLTIRELWDEPVWWQLGSNLRGSHSIYDVFNQMSADPNPVTCQMIIRPPGSNRWRGKTYFNVTIVDINEDENVTQAALTVARTVTAMYTHFAPLEIGR